VLQENLIAIEDRRCPVTKREIRSPTNLRSCTGDESVAERRARVENAAPAARAHDQTGAPEDGQMVGDVPGRAGEQDCEAGRVRRLVERAQDVGARGSEQVRECAIGFRAVEGRDGEPLWVYRYRLGGRGLEAVQRGGFVSEEDAAEALERELERLRRERRAAKSLTLAELVEV
jgi:hypothetical protein